MSSSVNRDFESMNHELPDPRTSDWLLMSSPCLTWFIVVSYIILVIQGPKWMKNREAFQLKTPMLVYNCAVVILSTYMFYEFVVSSWLRPGFSLICQPMQRDHPSDLRLANVVWWYYFSKLVELVDTLFFVLRKKNHQISVLHVYHHSTMPIIWWVGVRFTPGGEAYFSASINCFVHIVMYSYYLLAGLGPKVQKYLWWKKYTTKLQLMQLLAVELHTILSLYVDCGFPRIYLWALVFYTLSLAAFFANFYYHAYINKKTTSMPENDKNTKTSRLKEN